MKTIFVLIFPLLAFFLTAVPQESPKDLCKITYVANEGFLITTDSNRILIDALFGNIKGSWCDQPTDSVSMSMILGKPPFDKIDAVLITHKHSDHFKANMVIGFLKNNCKSIVICPSQVNDLLKSDSGYSEVSMRIHPFNSSYCPDTIFLLRNMKITALRFNHGPYLITDSLTGISTDIHKNVENFGYLVEADGFRIFHSGDGSATNKAPFGEFGFKTKALDIAFLDRSFLGRGGQDIVNEYIHAGKTVFMHVEPGKNTYYRSVIKDFPELFVFSKPMEEMVYSKTR